MVIAGKVFVVSGGASGLGEATCRALAGAGGKVLIADMNAEHGNRVADEIGLNAKFVQTDVTNEGKVQAAITAAVDAFGGLHGAVSCAGVGMAMRIVTKMGPHPLDVFKTVIDINLIGTFNVMRFAANVMAGNEPNDGGERGVLINTASVAAFDGQIGQIAYSASKAAIVGMTLPVARDLSKLGIRCVTIAPGLFDTPLMAMLPEDVKKALGDSVPFPNRLGMPAEFAALAKHIVENAMLNGETIRLDGALRMAPK
ncbi:MAG: 3-hydroxyacyl-CoA dehydrogenase [Candidatus Hydrogenedentes bacterium]|nr:3-hydroxyacyl-CoA dehydrogenase [Candidatus Hydrogenedentota bacterium]